MKMPCHITDEHVYNPWDREDEEESHENDTEILEDETNEEDDISSEPKGLEVYLLNEGGENYIFSTVEKALHFISSMEEGIHEIKEHVIHAIKVDMFTRYSDSVEYIKIDGYDSTGNPYFKINMPQED